MTNPPRVLSLKEVLAYRSQLWWSATLDVPQPSICRWNRGKYNPKPWFLLKIAKIAGVALDMATYRDKGLVQFIDRHGTFGREVPAVDRILQYTAVEWMTPGYYLER